MKRTRHTPEQIVTKLREADAMLAAGRSIAQVVQSLGVSEQTYNRWRDQFGGMKQGEARRLRELDIENARLKNLVADHQFRGMGDKEVKRLRTLEEENRRLKKAVADLTLDKQILKELNEGKW